jgi:hypothetical protein
MVPWSGFGCPRIFRSSTDSGHATPHPTKDRQYAGETRFWCFFALLGAAVAMGIARDVDGLRLPCPGAAAVAAST